jgi:hypothetical protein
VDGLGVCDGLGEQLTLAVGVEEVGTDKYVI